MLEYYAGCLSDMGYKRSVGNGAHFYLISVN